MSSKVIMRFDGHDIEGDAQTLADINDKLSQRAELLTATREYLDANDAQALAAGDDAKWFLAFTKREEIRRRIVAIIGRAAVSS